MHLGALDVLHRLALGVGRHVGAHRRHGERAQLLRRITIEANRRGTDVQDAPGVPVVDENAVLARLEDRAVARLGVEQRGLRAGALQLGRGAHGEDADHRFGQPRGRHRAARGDVQRERFACAVGDGEVAVGQHVLARRSDDGVVLDVVAERAVDHHGEDAHHAGPGGVHHCDERGVDGEQLGQGAHQVGIHVAAGEARHRQRGAAHQLLRLGALDLAAHPRGEDLEHGLEQRRVRQRPARHGDDQSERLAGRAGERIAGIAVHALGREEGPRGEACHGAGFEALEVAPGDVLAGRAAQRVLERFQQAAVEHAREGAHDRGVVVLEDRDEDRVGTEEVRERRGELGEDVLAAGAGDRERRAHEGRRARRGAVTGRGGAELGSVRVVHGSSPSVRLRGSAPSLAAPPGCGAGSYPRITDGYTPVTRGVSRAAAARTCSRRRARCGSPGDCPGPPRPCGAPARCGCRWSGRRAPTRGCG